MMAVLVNKYIFVRQDTRAFGMCFRRFDDIAEKTIMVSRADIHRLFSVVKPFYPIIKWPLARPWYRKRRYIATAMAEMFREGWERTGEPV